MARSRSVIWTQPSNQDLTEILEFVSKDSATGAKKLIKQIRKKADQLSIFPFLGRESSNGTRRLVLHHHYVLTYRVKPDRIEIVRVRHVARFR